MMSGFKQLATLQFEARLQKCIRMGITVNRFLQVKYHCTAFQLLTTFDTNSMLECVIIIPTYQVFKYQYVLKSGSLFFFFLTHMNRLYKFRNLDFFL